MNNNLYSKINIIYYLTLVAAIIETIGAIPVLGGLIIVLSAGAPLVALAGLYIAGLIFTIQAQNEPGADRYNIELAGMKNKCIIGIICAIVAFIPIVGWVLHIVMAIIMWLQYSSLMTLKNKISKDNLVDDIKAEDVKSDD
ncbi:hypothetical protein ACQW5G_04770 [Fructilactobacillus sp. Tb1]|uniref:hypothetical protein n=1 Tax=Fructilactobacillus sp. Tb1 TaxID=3422304 RepID=UPI003D28F98E